MTRERDALLARDEEHGHAWHDCCERVAIVRAVCDEIHGPETWAGVLSAVLRAGDLTQPQTDGVPLMTDAADEPRPVIRLRTGRKVPRTLYRQIGPEPSDDDSIVGLVDTASLATSIVAANEQIVMLQELVSRVRLRIRHDHAYPFEISDDHHCPGDDLEADIDAVLAMNDSCTLAFRSPPAAQQAASMNDACVCHGEPFFCTDLSCDNARHHEPGGPNCRPGALKQDGSPR